MTQQLEAWTARLEHRVEELDQRLADHTSQPWHVSFTPINQDIIKRLDRLEGLVLKVGGAVILLLFYKHATMKPDSRVVRA